MIPDDRGADPADRGRVPPDAVATPAPLRTLPPAGDVLLVAAGGAIGALARVALAGLAPAESGQVPWMTFVENVAGAFVLALLLTLLAERFRADPRVRLVVCTGALGAFTTYSALADEVAVRLRDGHVALGVGYAVTSVLLGVLAALAGAHLARARKRRRVEGRR